MKKKKKKNDADEVQKLSSDLFARLFIPYWIMVPLYFSFFFQDGKKQLPPGLQTAHFH